MEKEEIYELVSNELEVVTEQTVYKGILYALSYSIDSDLSLIFADFESEKNYEFLMKNMKDKPTSSIYFSMRDSTTCIFDTNVEHDNLLRKRRGSKSPKENQIRTVQNTNTNLRKDISNSKNKLDSGKVQDTFVYQKDVAKTYSIDVLLAIMLILNVLMYH